METYQLFTLTLNHVGIFGEQHFKSWVAQCTGTADIWAESHLTIALHRFACHRQSKDGQYCYFADLPLWELVEVK